jgi:hypothetical protein
VSPDTQLVVRSWNSLSGLVLTVVGRLLDADGKLRTFEFGHTPNTDRSKAESAYTLTAARLIDVAVTAKSGSPYRGHCYVTLGLARRTAPTTEYYQDLAKGYVTAAGGLIWPGGPYLDSVEGPGLLRSITGTDPAAGQEISETVPTNARWRLRALYAALVTDATVTDRRVDLRISDGTYVFAWLAWASTQPASATYTYQVAEYGYAPTTTGSIRYYSVPSLGQLLQGWRIYTMTNNLQAGDNWGAPQMLVEEWIEE